MISYNKLNRFIEERYQAKIDTGAFIGGEIRKKRLQSGKTLVDISGNDLSVSYLSKIENAKVTPKPFMLNEVLKRMDMDVHLADYCEEYQKNIELAGEYYFFNQENSIQALFDSICKNIEIDMTLVKLIYYIYKNQFQEAIPLLDALYQTKKSLSSVELETYLVFLMEFHRKSRCYKLTYEVYKILLKTHTKEKYLKLISEKSFLFLLYETKMIGYFEEAEKKYEKTLIEYNLYQELQVTREYLALAYHSLGFTSKSKLMYSNLPEKKDFNYVLYLIVRQEYGSARKWIHSILNSKNQSKCLLFSLYCDRYIGIDLLMKEDLKDINPKDLNEMEYKFYKYFYILNTEAPNRARDYLKKILWKNAYLDGDIRVYNFFGRILIEEASQNARYKDAYLISKSIMEREAELIKEYDEILCTAG